MNAPMTFESVTLGSSVHCLEKRRMNSQRVSSDPCRQALRSHELPGRTYVPWKFLTKTLTRSAQLLIWYGGWCSSQALAESARNKGRLQMMSNSSSASPSWQARW
jgi:hypothetical protein